MFKIALLILCGLSIVTSDDAILSKVSSSHTSSRIINGHLTTIEKFPFLVSLQYNGTFFNHSVVHFCCGNIIDRAWILTAAQCMKSRNIRNFHIRAGSATYFKDGEVYEPAEIIIHPKFNPERKDFDIALIKLSTGIVFNDRVQPIDLPDSNTVIEDEVLLDIAGWGKANQIDVLSDDLRETQVVKINKKVCESIYGDGSIPDENFCVYRNGYGPCIGDTGSPARLNNNLFGIASWSYSCGYNYPTAYTDISRLTSWILEVTGINSAKDGLNL